MEMSNNTHPSYNKNKLLDFYKRNYNKVIKISNNTHPSYNKNKTS